MFRGLYTAGSTLMTNNKKIDVVSNNIANVNSTGYKKDLVLTESFEETLLSKIDGDLPTNNLGPMSMKVENKGDYFEVSSNSGYFKVKTPVGISYHNKARFTVDEDGYLRTFYNDKDGKVDSGYGYKILGNDGPINVGDGQVNIDESGNVLVDGEAVGNILIRPNPSVIGTMSSGVKLERIETNFQQGLLNHTGNELDLAIDGEGFFEVETKDGIRYTRDGSFKLNQYNELVTSEGDLVQGRYGSVILDGDKINITRQGEVMVDGEVVDQLQMFNLENERDLRKTGKSLLKMAEGIDPIEKQFDGQILQGRLEKSNVDPIKEMVEMMTLYRGYESNQRMIKAYDQTIGKAVNEIGKV